MTRRGGACNNRKEYANAKGVKQRKGHNVKFSFVPFVALCVLRVGLYRAACPSASAKMASAASISDSETTSGGIQRMTFS
jgi:hypothetical protein